MLRKHCLGDSTEGDPLVNHLLAIFAIPKLNTCTDFTHFIAPLDSSRRALDSIVDMNMPYHEFMDRVVSAICINALQTTPFYDQGVVDIWRTARLSRINLKAKVDAYETRKRITGQTPEITSANGMVVESNGSVPRFGKDVVFAKHARCAKSVEICHFFLLNENCINANCKRRHHIDRDELELITAALGQAVPVKQARRKPKGKGRKPQANAAQQQQQQQPQQQPQQQMRQYPPMMPPMGYQMMAPPGYYPPRGFMPPPQFNPQNFLSQGFLSENAADDEPTESDSASQVSNSTATSTGQGGWVWQAQNGVIDLDLLKDTLQPMALAAPTKSVTFADTKTELAYFDSGANMDIVPYALDTTRPIGKRVPVKFGNGTVSHVTQYTSKGMVTDALVNAKSPNTLISVARQADQGRPSLFTVNGTYRLPPEMINSILQNPLVELICKRDNSTNGMYECIKEKFGLNVMVPPMVSIPRSRRQVLPFLELFSGDIDGAELTATVQLYGIGCPASADILRTGEDLRLPVVVNKIRKSMQKFSVSSMHSGNPCGPFAVSQHMNKARWPPGTLEAKQKPFLDMLELLLPLYKEHCDPKDGTHGFISFEGPARGMMWPTATWRKVAAVLGLWYFVVYRCAWDLQSPKPTMIWTNIPRWACAHMIARSCICPPGWHMPLAGVDPTTGKARTALAGPYRQPFTHGLALMHANAVAIVERERQALKNGVAIPDMNVPIRKVAQVIKKLDGYFTPIVNVGEAVLPTHTGNEPNMATAFHQATHMSRKNMLKTATQGLVSDVPYTTDEVRRMPDCPQCPAGNMKRIAFKGSTVTPNTRNEHEIIVYMDCFGPLPKTCKTRHNKYTHFAAFLSRRSRRSWVVFFTGMKNFKLVLRQFFNDYHAEFRQYPSVLHMDNASTNISLEAATELADHGCRIRTPAPVCEEGDPAENLIGQLVRGARILLARRGLDDSFFADAVICKNYLRNRATCSANFKSRSPYHIERGHAPPTSHYLPFGTLLWEYKPYDSRLKDRVNKVASKANAVMMVGYAADRGGRQAYRVYDFKKKRVFIRRHLKPWRSTTAAPIQIGDAAFRQFVREREAFGIKIPRMVRTAHHPLLHSSRFRGLWSR